MASGIRSLALALCFLDLSGCVDLLLQKCLVVLSALHVLHFAQPNISIARLPLPLQYNSITDEMDLLVSTIQDPIHDS